MICWSCERQGDGGAGPLCAACGAVLPADDRHDRFAVLGVPRGFVVDLEAVERLSRDPIDNSKLHTTCVATRLDAGHANNALPGRAEAVVNCRILPGH